MKDQNEKPKTVTPVASDALLVSFGDVPLGHRIQYPGDDKVFTVLSHFRNERDDELMSGTIAEYIAGSMSRSSLSTHFGGRDDCPDEVILID